MRKGFIFNHNRCVNCGACMASCVLENRWTINPRFIYTYNAEALAALPLVNLSLACNHCEEPSCLEACPSGSFSRESATGAIIIDDRKCIGCRYCQWNCPYDAPKFDRKERIIGKCNLCYSGLMEGRLPACASACPTGALNYGEIPETDTVTIPSWFPDKQLNPLIEFTGTSDLYPLRIIPEKSFEQKSREQNVYENMLKGNWSLIGFSFLTTLSVTAIITSIIKGDFPNFLLFASLIILAGIISLFHTGKVLRAWRSLSNIKTSPLSREIAIFIIFSFVSLCAVFFQLPALLIVSSVIGLIMLISIDNVYIYSDRVMSVIFHGGQTFLSSLLMISFFTGKIFPFILIALIKIVSSIINLRSNRSENNFFEIKFLRLALLLITGASLITGISYPDPVIIFLFLTGEFFDRINFYFDFRPLNIRRSVHDNLILYNNEEKRG